MNNNKISINTTMWFWHENIKNQLHISDAYRLLLNLLNIMQEPVNKIYQNFPDMISIQISYVFVTFA